MSAAPNGRRAEPPQARVGHIGFLNSLPFLSGLESDPERLPFELVVGPPSELNRRLLDGSLDVSPISSIRYAAHTESLVLLPRLCIASDGPVASVLLATRRDPRALDGRVVSLDPSSATSHALLKLILWERFGVRPRFQVRQQSALSHVDSDAALVIGDQALRTRMEPNGWALFDLGEEWKALSGCRMVYAVWAARREFAEQRPAALERIQHTLDAALARGLGDPTGLVARASALSGHPAEFLAAYYRLLHYGLGHEERAGLSEFYRRAAARKLLPAAPALSFAAA